MLGLGLSIPERALRGRAAFSPLALFAASEVGAWYDPSDINLAWRRNLLTQTEDFSQAVWVKAPSGAVATITTNTAVAPDDTTTADTLTCAASNNFVAVRRSPAGLTANTEYVFSVYAKPGTSNWINLRFWDSGANGINAWFNVSTGAVGTVQAGCIATTQLAANGYYRCVVRRTIGSSIAFNEIDIGVTDADNSYAATTGATVVIWGAQLEVGSTASAYQQIVTPEISYLTVQALPVMYQDAAGTTPVTAVEQPVGLMLDKSKGLTLGPELVTNGDFATDTWWAKGPGCTIAGGLGVATAAPNGSGWYRLNFLTIGRYYETTFTVVSCSSGGFRIRYFGTNTSATYSIPGTYTARILADTTGFVIETVGTTTGTIDNVSVKEVTGNHASQTTSTSRPTLSARYNQLIQSENLQAGALVWARAGTCTFSSPTVANFPASNDYFYQPLTIPVGTYTASFELSGTGTVSIVKYDTVGGFQFQQVTLTATPTRYTRTITFAAGGTDQRVGVGRILANGDTCTTVTASKADLRVANEPAALPAYQRVTTSTDYDTVGFPPYLRFDGTDDSLATASIDFSTGATNPPLGTLVFSFNGSSTTGWTYSGNVNGGIASSAGALVLTCGNPIAALADRLTSAAITGLTVNAWYKITGKLRNISDAAGARLSVAATAGAADTAGTFADTSAASFTDVTFYFQASSTTMYVRLIARNGTGAAQVAADDVFVREVDAAYAPDKMTVFGGYRRLTDAGPLILVELSASAVTNAGSFGWVAPNDASTRAGYNLNGSQITSQIDSVTAAAPNTLVATVSYDIAQSTSAQEVVVRLNGAPATTTLAGNGNAGTGTFGNYPLFIGRRNNATLPFNGRIYSLIVRGAATSAADITATESWVANKSGVVL